MFSGGMLLELHHMTDVLGRGMVCIRVYGILSEKLCGRDGFESTLEKLSKSPGGGVRTKKGWNNGKQERSSHCIFTFNICSSPQVLKPKRTRKLTITSSMRISEKVLFFFFSNSHFLCWSVTFGIYLSLFSIVWLLILSLLAHLCKATRNKIAYTLH